MPSPALCTGEGAAQQEEEPRPTARVQLRLLRGTSVGLLQKQSQVVRHHKCSTVCAIPKRRR